MAIVGFRHKGLEELFVRGRSRRIAPRWQRKLIELMDILDGAAEVRDLVSVAGFHGLTGRRRGTFAMTVTRNWRLTFRFEDSDVWEVDYEDYH